MYTVKFIKNCGTKRQTNLSRDFKYFAWADKFACKMLQEGYSHIVLIGNNTCIYYN